MRILRPALTLGLTVCAAAALATGSMMLEFNKAYKPKAGGNVQKAACNLCHSGKMDATHLNPFGLDIKAALAKAKATKLNADILKKVEDIDSDKDGKKNIAEIKADTLPGDPKSK